MITQSPRTEGYFSRLAASHYAGVSARTLDHAVARGELAVFRLVLQGRRCRKILYRRADIDAWLDRYRVVFVPAPDPREEDGW